MHRPLSAILLLTAAVATISRPPSEPLNWRSHGPANVTDFVAASTWDPADTTYNSMYAVGPGGVYHSADRGKTWARRNGQLDNLNVSHIAIARKQPHIVYITTGLLHTRQNGDRILAVRPVALPGTGVYRSEDAGHTWTPLPLEVTTEEMKYLTNVVTSHHGDSVMVATQRRVLRSIDHGQTWQEVLELPEIYGDPAYPDQYWSQRSPFIHLSAAPGHFDNVLLIRTERPWHSDARRYNYNVLQSFDGGTTWSDVVIDGRTLEYYPDDGYSHEEAAQRPPLPFHTAVDSILWATARDQAWRSTDYGATWTQVQVPLRKDWLRDVPTPHPFSADTLTYGYPFVYKDGQLVVSETPIDPSQWYNPHRNQAYQHVQPKNRGPFRWSWHALDAPHSGSSPPGPFLNAQVFTVCKLQPTGTSNLGQHRYLATALEIGLMLGANSSKMDYPWHTPANNSFVWPSRDMDSFTLCHPTKPHHAITRSFAGYLRSDHASGDQDTWINYHDHAWTEQNWPPGSNIRIPIGGHIHMMDTHPEYPDRVYMVTNEGIFISEDWAHSWRKVGARVSDLGDFIHVSRADANHIITRMSRSRDGGRTWENLGGLAFPPFAGEPHTDWVMQERIDNRSRTTASSLDAVESNRDATYPWELPGWIRLVTHKAAPEYIWTCTPVEIRRWSEDLTEYTTLATADDIGVCRDMIIMESDPNWFWVGTDRGLYETTDGGETWRHAPRGLPPVPIAAFDVRHGLIILGTLGRGVYSVSQAEVEAIRLSAEQRLFERPGEQPFTLSSNWPNPFSNQTTLAFELDQPATVTLDVYDVTGRLVTTLTSRRYNAGRHQVDWQAAEQARGVYFVRMTADGRPVSARKVARR